MNLLLFYSFILSFLPNEGPQAKNLRFFVCAEAGDG